MNDDKRINFSLTHVLICAIAALGFAFDIYELLMGPLVFAAAIQELTGHAPGSKESLEWIRWLFFIPAFAGGIFGLLGGYLTDILGRRRVLTWSILLYASSAFVAGYSTSIEMLLFMRCLIFIGVCVEFVAAVAWLAELFPDHNQREKVLGSTQFFSSIGGLLVAVANGLAVSYGKDLPAIGLPDFLSGLGEIKGDHAPWRYTLMSGLIPAIPLILIRPFLPESPAWAEKKAKGTLRRPSILELFSPELLRTTIVSTIMVACSFGAAFGAIQMVPQIVPGLPEVKALVKSAVDEKFTEEKQAEIKAQVGKKLEGESEEKIAEEMKKRMEIERRKIVSPIQQGAAANVTKVQEVGGLIGRGVFAILTVFVLSRRSLVRMFIVPGIILMPIVFAFAAVTGLNLLYVGIFLAGLVTVAQYSFWGNYLPTVYPVHLRGTGESFAHNIGGRMIGTSMAWVTTTLAASSIVPIEAGPAKVAYVAAGVSTIVLVIGFLASFFLPDPGIKMQDDQG
ncbi:MAG: MFS transporter [Planctomycetota bacterium]